MLRYDQSPTSNSIDFEFSVDDKPGRSALNTSMNSAISAGLGSTASSSKAVLAALRALQDKIRRLEVEKTQALDDAAQLRSQLKSQEIETDHAKERDTLHQQKSLQEARIRYETVLAEKTDMESKIHQLQQHNHNIEQELEAVKAKNRSLEATHTSSAEKLADLEDQISHLERELQGSRQKEKDLSSAMIWETRRHDDEMRALSMKLESVNTEMSSSSVARVEKETKLVELDHLVGQLLAVNETLVHQLANSTARSGTTRGRSKSSTKVSTMGASKKKKVSKKTSIVPRAASVSTASVDAKVAATEERRRSRSAENKRNGNGTAEAAINADRLLGMHEMYVSLASTITGKKMGAKTKTGKSSSASVVSGRSVSTLGGGSASTRPKTRIKGRKMNTGNTGESIESTSGGIMGIHHVDVPYGQPMKKLDDFESKYNLSSQGYGSESNELSTPGSRAQASAELRGVISSLEDEFNSLNAQYQQLLSAADNVGGHGTESQSRELVSVIQKLHKKGEQLRALKSPIK